MCYIISIENYFKQNIENDLQYNIWCVKTNCIIFMHNFVNSCKWNKQYFT